MVKTGSALKAEFPLSFSIFPALPFEAESLFIHPFLR